MCVPCLALCAALAGAAPAAPEVTAPPTDDARPRLLLLALESRGVAAELSSTIDSLIVVEAGKLGAYDVISAADVRRMADLEASRSTAGCGDASCLAEIAGAMGASLVLFGDVGVLGSTYTITLNLFDSSAARALGRESIQTDRPASLGASLGPALRRLVEPDAAARGLVLSPPSPQGGDGVGLPVLVGGVASVVCAAAVVGVGVGHLPWLQFSGAADVARTTTSQAEYDAAQATMDVATDAYTSWGQPLAVASGITAGVSGVVAVVAFSMLALEEGP